MGLASFARSAGATAGVVALLGGPAGLAMLATQIAVAGGAYLLMTKHTQDATSAFEEQGLALSELREKYKKLYRSTVSYKRY